MTTVYIGERQSGKTTTLIEMSEKTGATIVVENPDQYHDGNNRDTGQNFSFCNFKITHSQSPNRFCGASTGAL